MLSCLTQVMEALLTVTDNVGHYEAMDKTDKYCVWAEDMEASSLEADNYKAGQMVQGTVDYFTKDEDDPNIENFQIAFNAAGFNWSLNSVQYEDETGYIHYEWLFNVRNEYDGTEVIDGDDEVEGD